MPITSLTLTPAPAPPVYPSATLYPSATTYPAQATVLALTPVA